MMKPFLYITLYILMLSLNTFACSDAIDIALATQIVPAPSATREASVIDPILSTPDSQKEKITQSVQATPSSRLDFMVEKAKKDLAQRLGISVDSIIVSSVIGQEFSIEAFNCQTSKERVAKEESPQVISGRSIVLSALGLRYEYHASDQTVIFCRSLP